MLPAGTVLNGDYRIEHEIGRGGFSTVYLAIHTRIPRMIAIKVINPHQNQDPDFLERFWREAAILATLAHPNLIRVTDWNTINGNPYLVMDYLPGMDLAAYLRTTGPLPWPCTIAIIRQIGSALQAAHDIGVVHRDLKPGNIYVCSNYSIDQAVRVLDFGIAKIVRSTTEGTPQDSGVIGTPAYMSPEQALGSLHVDARSDQFSLSILIYEMLTGIPGFARPGEVPVTTLHHVLYDALPPLPSGLALGGVNAVLQRAMAKEPTQRFASVRDFVAALEHAAAEPENPAPTTLSAGAIFCDVAAQQSRASSSGALTVAADLLPVDSGGYRRALLRSSIFGAAFALVLILSFLGWRSSDQKTQEPRTTLAAGPNGGPLRDRLPIVPGLNVPARTQETELAPAPSALSLRPTVNPAPPIRQRDPAHISPSVANLPRSRPPAAVPTPDSRPQSTASNTKNSELPRPALGSSRKARLTLQVSGVSPQVSQAVKECLGRVLKEAENPVPGMILLLKGYSVLRLLPQDGVPAETRRVVNRCLEELGREMTLPRELTVRVASATAGGVQ